METIICPNCKSQNTGESQFCQVCGTPLKRAVDAPSSTPQPAAVPPPLTSAPVPMPPPVPSSPPAYYAGTPVHWLGVWMDGWSDVIEGAADHAVEIYDKFKKEIEDAGIEGLRSAESKLTSGTSAPRTYHVVQNQSGATVAVRITPYGRSLKVSWDLCTRRTPNWVTIGVLGGVVIFFAILASINSIRYDSGLAGFLTFFSVITGWTLTPVLGLMVAGKICNDDIWGLFIHDLDDFAMEDAESLAMVVDSALSNAILDVLDEGEDEEIA